MRPTPGTALSVVLLSAALACVFAQREARTHTEKQHANHFPSAVPTTLATLPLDSEGLTVDPHSDTLYTAEAPNAAGDCFVRSVSLSGVVTDVGVVPRPSAAPCAPRGLAFRDGRLYIADQGTGADGWIFEMDPVTGQATTYASGVAGANGIAFDAHGNLWITDGLRGLGRVYRREAATAIVEEVFRTPPVANGVTYGGLLTAPSALGIGRQIINVPAGPQGEVRAVANGIAVIDRGHGATVYVTDTARGALWTARLDSEGQLMKGQTGCDPTLQLNTLCEDALFVSHPRIEGADGIWADWFGGLWVAANARQALVRVDRRGNVKEVFRNPVNSQLLRSSSDTVEGNSHIFEYPTNPVIVPSRAWPYIRTICVSSTDRPGRDNWPGTVGEIGGPGQPKGKISCF